jgi:hypothetical protein
MATLTLTISKLRFPSNANISNPITVKLEYREYYSDTFILIDTGVNVDVDGTILDSPLPTITIDTDFKYVIRATNEFCDFQYEQSVIINPYCPVGYEMSDDGTYCFFIEEASPTPPSNPQNTVSKTLAAYNSYGTLIYDPGFNVNGTGSFTQISYSNTWWVNGVGYPSLGGNTTDGAMNRSGLWTVAELDGQIVGYTVCVTIPTAATYYIGISADNKGTIRVDGTTVLDMNPAAMMAFLIANGYPGILDEGITSRFWHIYPVSLNSGVRVLEIVGQNAITGIIPNPASVGIEVYNLTSAQIQAATSYVDMGSGLIFSSKDYIGQPVQVGSDGFGYTCPDGFSLSVCDSPLLCRRVLITPVLY